mgnify:CR=1 FL=1
MNELVISYWTIFGIVCIALEFLLPGFVLSFLGLGAFTVSLLVHFGYISDIPMQFSAFFISSIIYLFTLRILSISFNSSFKVKLNSTLCESSQSYGPQFSKLAGSLIEGSMTCGPASLIG